MNFSGKTIWITGASSGIGRAVALELSKFCDQLIISGRNRKTLNEVGEQCKASGCRVHSEAFDLGDVNSVVAAADAVLKLFPRIDCLYHFGGISQRSLVVETSLELDRKIFEINYFGTVALTKSVLPQMLKNGGANIAFTSSIVGKFGFPYRSAYSASKHALHGFAETLRAENTASNLCVNVIIPGRVKTNISLNALNSDGNQHGELDAGQAGGMSAECAARVILKGLKNEKKEILVGKKELIMVHIRRFFPSLYYRLVAKVKPF